MTLTRRTLIQLTGGLAATAVAPRFAGAQAYPSRPVRIVVAFSPGGAPDIVARLIAQALSERLGQRFLVENKGGAGGTLGTMEVVKSPADGTTLLLVAPNDAINASMYEKLSYNFLRDIEPVVGLVAPPNVLEVHPSVPVNTVPELIAYLKANPGKLSLASPGIGSGPHLASELFRTMAGVDFVHVPYRGAGAALTDTVGGQVQMIITTVPSSREFVRTGKLRALATTGRTHSTLMPEIPLMSDYLPGFEASLWTGIGVPKNTPLEIVATLNREVNAVLADPKLQARFADLDSQIIAGTPEDFRKFVTGETEKWAKVVRAAGIKPE